MSQPSKEQAIAFLLDRRRFGLVSLGPAHAHPIAPADVAGSTATARRDLPTRAAMLLTLEYQLRNLTQDELMLRYETELLVAHEEQERRDESLPFNQVAAKSPDYGHWSRAACWTLEEAVALSLGREPSLVSWDSVASYMAISTFAVSYLKRRELVYRARRMAQLFDPAVPGFFLGWAKRCAVEVPQALIEAVEARGELVGDWKTWYDDLRATTQAQRQRDEAVIAALGQQIAALKTEAASPLRKAKIGEISGKERESVLKLIIGMATGGYVFDPTATKSRASSEIASDVAKLGLSIDEDTVRKYLHEAAILLAAHNADDPG